MHIIARTLDLLERTSSVKRHSVRDILLAQFGSGIVPFCAAKYEACPPSDYRADLVRFVLRYARTDRQAVELAVRALDDRSRKVRHNACAVLAYSLQPSAIEKLTPLRTHRDAATATDAERAIEAIRSCNHNRFYPTHSSWGVFPDDPDQPKAADVQQYIVQAAPELVAPLAAILGDLNAKVAGA